MAASSSLLLAAALVLCFVASCYAQLGFNFAVGSSGGGSYYGQQPGYGGYNNYNGYSNNYPNRYPNRYPNNNPYGGGGYNSGYYNNGYYG